MMSGSGPSRLRKMVLACAAVLLAGLPLLGWAQGAAPKPTSTPAATPQTITLPSSATKDSTAKAAAAAPAAPAAAKAPTLSDSARAALKAEIEHELKAMADTLKLTAEQRAQARPILLDHAYQVRSLRGKYAAQERTPAVTEAMQKDMQVLRDSTDARMARVLTADQMTQYRMKRDEWLGRTRTRHGLTGTPAAAGAPAPGDTAKKAAPADTAAKK